MSSSAEVGGNFEKVDTSHRSDKSDLDFKKDKVHLDASLSKLILPIFITVSSNLRFCCFELWQKSEHRTNKLGLSYAKLRSAYVGSQLTIGLQVIPGSTYTLHCPC